MWHIKGDMWHMACSMWQVACESAHAVGGEQSLKISAT